MGFFSRLFGARRRVPTPDEFATLAIEAMGKCGVPGPLEYDRGAFVVRGQGEQRYVANLANAYREYCEADEGSRPQVLGRFFAPFQDLESDWSSAAGHLLPVCRNRTTFGLSLLQGALDLRSPVEPPPSVRLGEHLEIGLALDSETRITQVMGAELERWGVDFDTALAQASTNLRDRSQDPWIEPAPRLYVSPWRDHYDASRLFLPDLIHRLRVKGDPVAVVPNRLMTIVTGSDDLPMLELMLELCRRGLTQDRPVSAIPLRLEGQRWYTWQPELDHPSLIEFAHLRLQELADAYAIQKQVLEKQGEARFLATYSAALTPGSPGFSYATWTEGVETLLPTAERIAFVRSCADGSLEPVGLAPFEKVAEQLKGRLTRTPHWPPRWCTNGFPTPEELAALPLLPPSPRSE